eukprot:SAG22_NODE_87_length_21437_cov_14.162480_18_plen_549_part_00
MNPLVRESADDYSEENGLLPGRSGGGRAAPASSAKWKKALAFGGKRVGPADDSAEDVGEELADDDSLSGSGDDGGYGFQDWLEGGDGEDSVAATDADEIDDKEKAALIKAAKVGLSSLPPWLERRQIIEHALEDWLFGSNQDHPAYQGAVLPFDEWSLSRTNELKKSEMRSQAQATGSGSSSKSGEMAQSYGMIKGFIRVVDRRDELEIRDMDTMVLVEQCQRSGLLPESLEDKVEKGGGALTEHDVKDSDMAVMRKSLIESRKIPFPLDRAAIMNPKQVFVRFYLINGFKFAAHDAGNTSDPYAVVALGDMKVNDRKNRIMETVNPYFGRCFELQTTLPGPALLQVDFFDYDALTGDDLIGSTTIDLEDRWFSGAWKKRGITYEADEHAVSKIRKEEMAEEESLAAELKAIATMRDKGLRETLAMQRKQHLEVCRAADKAEAAAAAAAAAARPPPPSGKKKHLAGKLKTDEMRALAKARALAIHAEKLRVLKKRADRPTLVEVTQRPVEMRWVPFLVVLLPRRCLSLLAHCLSLWCLSGRCGLGTPR